MTVVCEYCDSVVEVKGSQNCPFCGATLKDAIAKETERINAETEKQRKEQEKKEENEKLFDLAATVLGSSAGRSIIGTVIKEAIKRDL